jgi:SAM-dependent methyltransferase
MAQPTHRARGPGAAPGGSSPAQRCAWCGVAFDESARALPGRRQCGRCGAATTDPWPSDAELGSAYGGWYRPAEGRFSGVGDALLRWLRGRLAQRLDRIAPPGPVLDVGAGAGALVDALRARGREAVGLERRPARPDFEERELTEVEGSFAAVVFWHSLEHLREPREALARAASLLMPRGVLVVAMPNAASLQARAFGARWLALDLPRHLVHLPAGALVERLGELGLSVERVSHLRGGQAAFGWLHGLVDLLPGRPSLYDAIRRPAARAEQVGAGERAAALAAGALLLPVAAAAAGAEAAARRGGSVYVEARRG